MGFARTSFTLFLFAASTLACRKSEPPSIPAEHVPGTPHTDQVLGAWRTAGLEPAKFGAVMPPPYGATYCEHGAVRGVDTLVCEYASEQALEAGIQQVKQGWERVDAHTGVVLRTKRTLMVVADRERREPSGKTINQMAKVFSAL